MKVRTDNSHSFIRLRMFGRFSNGNEGVKTCRFVTANVLQTSQNLVWPRRACNIYFHKKTLKTFAHVLLPKLSNCGGTLLSVDLTVLYFKHMVGVSVVNLRQLPVELEGKSEKYCFPAYSPHASSMSEYLHVHSLIMFLLQISYYYWVCFQIHSVNVSSNCRKKLTSNPQQTC